MDQNSNIRILIVDEDELSLALIKSSLELHDFHVELCLDCESALEASAKECFSLVICDRSMRLNTGAEVESLIHSIPQNREVPFLFTSSCQQPDVISRRQNDKNIFIVRKPFEHEAFVNLVQFAMWRPHLIRSHIERVHLQQGLKDPYVSQEPVDPAPTLQMPAFGITPIQLS